MDEVVVVVVMMIKQGKPKQLSNNIDDEGPREGRSSETTN